MAGASLRISTLYLGIVILTLFGVRTVRAEEVSEIAPTVEIEAKAYDLKTIRPSKSGRVYLLQKIEDEMPVPGKIFLLRQGDTPVMALRVLKTYPKTKRIAAKKLLPYEGFPALERGSEYRAYEKVGNKVAPVPPSPEDLKDLKELEAGSLEDLPPEPVEETTPPAAEVPPADALPPAEEQAAAPGRESLEEPGDEDSEMKHTQEEDEIDEIGTYYPNFFTMAVGLLAKTKVPGPDTKLGGGILYSRNLGPSWAFEGGFFYYKSSGDTDDGTTIATTIIPIIGNLRYQKRFGDLWTGFVYGGIYFPWVSTNLGATSKQLGEIQMPNPSFGVGAFLQTGPNWYLRFNLGYESFTVGVSLRY